MALSTIRWDVDPNRPIRVGYFPDHNTGDLTIIHEEDVEHVLKKNQELFKASHAMDRRASSWHLWARVPPGIVMKWKAEYGIDMMKSEDMPQVVRLLHDPAWSKLRTAAGSYQERPTRHYPTTRSAGVIAKIGKSASLVRQGSYGAS